ncbi:MAG TPA: alpha-amylase family protein [Mucilaginibacter sp.]|nr:alpha-amylase family protein [Mucilaginibacter sp.]
MSNLSAGSNKLVIYQLLPRLFSNTNTTNKFYGTLTENGTGKLNDINDKALQELAKLGITHLWFTGIIEHATMTDYSAYGIKPDDPDVVKGIAGSPYAVKDYYDVDPDLAIDVKNRMAEYEDLIKRTHANDLKVMMDFVPNHVARTYASDTRPEGVRDFGQDDDNTKAFDVNNDFYYLPGQLFNVPYSYNAGGDDFKNPLKDGRFDENPAKVTGNNVYSPSPGLNDWFETVKLNYGIDVQNNNSTHYDPPPPLWHKLYHILNYWSAKGVDGFRCDMVENVPFEFWGWVIGKLKADFPGLIFIGEAYNVRDYRNYIFDGKFDYLYDKTGIFEAVRKLTTNQPNATVWDINFVWNNETNGFDQHMLRFMENHDEQRVASDTYAGNAWYAVPGMIICATLSNGPLMIYFGQEVGEPGDGQEGFGDKDGRTTIFDYWGVPEHQKWVNGGQYDGGKLSDSQKNLRQFYSKLLNAVQNNEALFAGKFYELLLANQYQSNFNERIYMYVRYTVQQRILVIVSFDRNDQTIHVNFPQELLSWINVSGSVTLTDLLTGNQFHTQDIETSGLTIAISQMSGLLLDF